MCFETATREVAFDFDIGESLRMKPKIPKLNWSEKKEKPYCLAFFWPRVGGVLFWRQSIAKILPVVRVRVHA